MKRKKGLTAVEAIIWLALGVFTFFVLAVIVTNQLGKGSKGTEDLLTSSRDYDSDGVADFFDKCACAAGDERFNGCENEAQMNNPPNKEACKKEIDAFYGKK